MGAKLYKIAQIAASNIPAAKIGYTTFVSTILYIREQEHGITYFTFIFYISGSMVVLHKFNSAMRIIGGYED